MAEATTLSITAGATAQDVFGATVNRKALIFSNTSDTIMYLRFGTTAVSLVGVAVAGGATVTFQGTACPTGRVSVMCATTSKTFYAYEL